MLMKWLLIIGVVAAVYFLFFKKPALAGKSEGKEDDKKPDSDTMVPCEVCGVFVSVREAYLKDGKYFCSKTCMEQY